MNSYRIRNRFYSDLDFSVDLITDYFQSLEKFITPYKNFNEKMSDDYCHYEPDYALEFLILSVYWNSYCGTALNTPYPIICILKILTKIRSRFRILKTGIDFLKGFIFTVFFKRDYNNIYDYNLVTLGRLINWLEGVGDFKEEVSRLNRIMFFLKTLPEDTINEYFLLFRDMFEYFQNNISPILKNYTFNGDSKEEYISTDFCREDYVLRDKSEIEYHLIMVGAELMNRSLKDKFLKTEEKILLIPACARPYNNKNKKCRRDGFIYHCTECNQDCNVFQIKKLGEEKKIFKTLIIPHSTDFTNQLKKWQNQEKIGLIASACVAHLFLGGYEMKKLHIPSQCIFLNFSGCSSHWTKKGIPTEIDLNRLLQLL